MRRTPLMKRFSTALIALLLAGAVSLRADQITAAVQQALKDQGFYYGAVTGNKDDDTKAAIRRYQIRNGLQITGEIDAETLRSLGVSSDAGRRAPQTQPTAPSVQDEAPPTQSAEINPPPDYRAPNAPPPVYPQGPSGPRMNEADVFAGTPYEMAPPDLQRHVIVGAQALLARYGYYRAGVDGEFGPATAAALRVFQARAGLVPNGRLNMATLGALGLLPGQRAPGFIPPRPQYYGRPVYRGEWIPYR